MDNLQRLNQLLATQPSIPAFRRVGKNLSNLKWLRKVLPDTADPELLRLCRLSPKEMFEEHKQ